MVNKWALYREQVKRVRKTNEKTWKENFSKYKKSTFDFELFANLTADLFAQVFQLLAERSVRHVRL